MKDGIAFSFSPCRVFPKLRQQQHPPHIGKFYVRCDAPKRECDYCSGSHSQYWFGEDVFGKYEIRKSDHWGLVGQSCLLLDGMEFPHRIDTEMLCGKTYLNIIQK